MKIDRITILFSYCCILYVYIFIYYRLNGCLFIRFLFKHERTLLFFFWVCCLFVFCYGVCFSNNNNNNIVANVGTCTSKKREVPLKTDCDVKQFCKMPSKYNETHRNTHTHSHSYTEIQRQTHRVQSLKRTAKKTHGHHRHTYSFILLLPV